MKKLFSISALAAAAALAYAGAASAADMPLKAPPAPAPVWTWTGLYSGVNVGGGWGTTSFIDNSQVGLPPGLLESFGSLSGPIGGTQTGYRMQFGQFVVGVEGSFSWADINQTIATPLVFPAETDRFAVRNIWTGTAQAGWAFDRFLVYAKGGYAGGEAEVFLNNPVIGGFQSTQNLRLNGWTAGGGIEWMLLQNLSIGIEYDHYDMSYGNQTSPVCATTPAGGCGLTPYTQLGGRVHVDAVVARANLKSDWFTMLFR